ncbi:somatostatin receptor type 2-like [Ptychodera flava]|uniref:somatostatin receptor type 2-like n=1 Tax=Ptychodera flava TaxID=63121 RepID=UPI00396A0FE2
MESNDTFDPYLISPAHSWNVLDFLEIIIGVAGLIGNVIVCVVMTVVKDLRTQTNCYVVNLAVSDSLSSLFLVLEPFLKKYVQVGEFYCRFIQSAFIFWVCMIESIFSLVAVTLERFVAIVYPFLYQRWFTPTTIAWSIVTTWILSVLSELKLLLIWQSDGIYCIYGWTDLKYSAGPISVMFSLNYVFPAVFMVYAYAKMIDSLKKDARQIQTSSTNQADAELLTARRRVITLLLIVVGAFFVCHTPNHFLYFAWHVGFRIEVPRKVYTTLVILTFLNSCVNPIIYAFRIKKFRKGCRRILCPFIPPDGVSVAHTV